MYNNKVFEMSVLETKPANAVSVIECDLNVDFAAPVGYKEPEFNRKPNVQEEDQVRLISFV
jgi:ubiquitin fusion degradation protein 1